MTGRIEIAIKCRKKCISVLKEAWGGKNRETLQWWKQFEMVSRDEGAGPG